MKRRIRTTAAQRDAMEGLKQRLAEKGYFIFPLRHGIDGIGSIAS